jgi:hypothetical protein
LFERGDVSWILLKQAEDDAGAFIEGALRGQQPCESDAGFFVGGIRRKTGEKSASCVHPVERDR